MPTIDAATLTADELTPMLRNWARGVHSARAAVSLVIDAGIWLQRPDFRHDSVVAVTNGTRPGARPPLATIVWHTAALYAEDGTATPTQAALLRLACSLGGANTGSLRELTAALDPISTARLIDALTHRSGWQVAGITHTTTGHQKPPALAGDASPEIDGRPAVGHRLRHNEQLWKGASWTGC